jgi:hypothetical protein
VKSLKLFVDPAHAQTPTGGVTFAYPGAKPGPVRDRARNILIRGRPNSLVISRHLTELSESG